MERKDRSSCALFGLNNGESVTLSFLSVRAPRTCTAVSRSTISVESSCPRWETVSCFVPKLGFFPGDAEKRALCKEP